MSDTLRSLLVRISADASGLDRAMTTALAKTKRFGSEMSSIGSSFSAAVTLPLAGVGVAAIKAAADMDSLTRGLKAVTKDTGPLTDQLKRLQDVAKLPGLGFQEAIQGSIRLQAAGFSAKQAESSLKAFGNALATVGKGKADLDGVTLALSQIASKGKISAEEINQLAERVPQIRKAIDAAFGEGAGAFDAKQWKEAGVSAEEFVAKVTAELGKLPAVTGGVKNSFENFSDASQRALAALGKAMLEGFGITEKLDAIAASAEKAGKAFSEMSPAVQKFSLIVAGVVAAIGPVVWFMGTMLEKGGSIIKFFREWSVIAKTLAAALHPVTLVLGYLVYQTQNIIKAYQGLKKEWNDIADQVSGRKLGWNMAEQFDAVLAKLKPTVPAMALVKSSFEQMHPPARVATDGIKNFGAELEKSGGPIQRTAHDLIALADSFKRVRDAKAAIAKGPSMDWEAPELGTSSDAKRTIDDAVQSIGNVNEQLERQRRINDVTNKSIEEMGPKWKVVGTTANRTMVEVQREVKRAFDAMTRGMANALVQWKGFGETAKGIAQSFASGIMEIFVQRLLDPLQKKFEQVLGSILGGGGKPGVIMNATGGGASSAAGGISSGGSAGSSAASGAQGLMGAVNMVSGIVTAVSSVIGNFQFAAMNKSLDLIEHEVRYSQIHLGYLLEKANAFWPYMEHTHQRLVELNDVRGPISEIRDSLKNLKIEVKVLMDGRQVSAGVVSQLKLEGALG